MAKPAWIPTSDTELYQKVLVLFSIIQLVLGLALYVLTTTAKPMLYLLFVVAIVCAVLSHRFWHSRPARVVGRGFTYLLPVGFLAGAVVAQVGFSGMSGTEWEKFGINTPLILHTMLLFLIPSMALAALHGRRMDVNSLRVMSVLNTLLAGVLYLVPAVQERIELGVDNLYFRLFCLLCVAVTMVAAFLIPPPAFQKPAKKPAGDEAPAQNEETAKDE